MTLTGWMLAAALTMQAADTPVAAAQAPALSPAEMQQLVEQVLRALQSSNAVAPDASAAPALPPAGGPPGRLPPAAPPVELPRSMPPPGPRNDAGSGPRRDPFSTSPTMERESQRLGLNSQQSVASLPQLSLRGYCNDGRKAVAWLETPDGELILAYQGEPLWIGALELNVLGMVDGALEIQIPSLDTTLSVR